MYIENLNNFIKSDYLSGENGNQTFKGKSEFSTLLNKNVQGKDARKKLMFLQSGIEYPLRPKLPGFQESMETSRNKEGLKISLQWQDGEIEKSNEIPDLGERRYGKNEFVEKMANILKLPKGGKNVKNNELVEKMANILKLPKGGKNVKNNELVEKMANILKLPKGGKNVKNNELVEKMANTLKLPQGGKNLKINEMVGEAANVHKVINGEKWSSPKTMRASPKDGWDIKKSLDGEFENSRATDLFNILGIKNSEISKNLDFSNSLSILKLDSVENGNVKNLVGQITDYLIQNGIKNLDFLEVVVDHEDLGRFKIDVQKNGNQGLIDLKIEVMTAEGKDFFQQNEALLAKNLNNAGINIQDLKIIDFKDNIMLNSFSLKNDNTVLNLEKDIQGENNNSQHKNEDGKKDERYRRSRQEYMNEEENDAEHW